MALLAVLSFQFRGKNLLRTVVFFLLLLVSVGLGAFAGLLIVYKSDLPEVKQLEDYRPNVITELYADDGRTIGSFALERRVVVTYEQLPALLVDALLVTEDQNFERHWGIDVTGIGRAIFKGLFSGKRIQGTSTLTQQLSRLCFLNSEKSFKRKFQELLFSIQIERFYTKHQILTLYGNQVPLGHRNYGFAAAAQYYFSKSLGELNLGEVAVLAAMPAVAHFASPITNPDRILLRRNYVLDRMAKKGKISVDRARTAKASPLELRISTRHQALAPYFAEEIRKGLEQKYGSDAVNESGLRVYTTLNVDMQQAANEAVRWGLEDFDRRHGWRGTQKNVLQQGVPTLESFRHEDWKRPKLPGSILTGLIVAARPKTAQIRFGEYEAALSDSDIAWTGRKSLTDLFKLGDLALFRVSDVDAARKRLKVVLYQPPEIQGALVALDSATGAVKALVGGYDFDQSKFNRATQAFRQTGSAFKPFVFTLAIDQGMNPNDTIEDSPVSFPSRQGTWSPQNYDRKFEGTITLRRAMAQSRNIPAVKLLSRFGIEKEIEYVKRFGVTSPNLAPYLPMALGSAEVTLLEMTSAYSVFPNDGVRVLPRLTQRVADYGGTVKEENLVEVREVIPQSTSRAMVDLLRSVVEVGTAQRAKSLQRPIAGKTGTTNNYTDAWFIGFTPSLTCGVWVGYDKKRSLGKGETGARAALPIWMRFMERVLKDKPVEEFGELSLPEKLAREKLDTPDDASGDGETTPE
ncbi:MAG: PBP1A family penicillin-binding protein [Acidimicrobiia bacterium]|nr:PBP1A family penicillin-binding protein [Acidimicrobiia bacterium]